MDSPLWAATDVGYTCPMGGGIHPGLGKALSIMLVGLLLFAGLPCAPAAPLLRAEITSFDPCRQRPAPAPQCTQACCKAFDLPARAAVSGAAAAAPPPFHSTMPSAQGRLVQPPLPPPRSPMI